MTAQLPFDRIRLFELPKPKIGAEESKAIVDAIDSISANAKNEVDIALESNTKSLATKDDLHSEARKQREDIHALSENECTLQQFAHLAGSYNCWRHRYYTYGHKALFRFINYT